ncbi:lysosomal acid glucosylceramidase-like [Palaemon carinicauda]|uniref:lysosomal acid glucosylceramidase-like n=1 Tax=Palaemon carinicauda TaxID=392227 RepID=UPI0035B631C4
MALVERKLQLSIDKMIHCAYVNGFKFSTSKYVVVHFCCIWGVHPDPDMHIKGKQTPCKLGLVLWNMLKNTESTFKYTDGSKSDSDVGFGVCNSSFNCRGALPLVFSIFITELYGILAALENIEKMKAILLNAVMEEVSYKYSLGRIPIGGTDFSTHPYTYDDLKPGDVDPLLFKFSLAQEDLTYKIPFVKRALNMSENSVKLFASAWGAPAWMKSNGKIYGKGKLLHQFYSSWAHYHVLFLKSYEEHNISFWGLTTQNEPTDGLVKNFPFNSIGWTAQEQGEWIGEHLGPALNNNSFGSLEMMILDDNRFLLPKWVDDVMSNKQAASYVTGVGIHWYLDWVTPANLLDYTHKSYPDLFLLYTEACSGQWPWQPLKVVLGSWVRAQNYASDIIENLQHWVSGWTDWNLALDMKGGPNWVKNYVDSPVIVNAVCIELSIN